MLELIYQSRENDDDPFQFWFSTTSKTQAGKSHEGHFRDVEALGKDMRKRSKGRLTLNFNEEASLELSV